MSSSKKVTVGYKYSLGLHMVLCHGPVDNISKIVVDGRPAWTGLSTGGNISVNAPNHFGGEDKEGGISGTVQVEMGASTQPRNSYLQSKIGSNIPAYRGVVGMVLNQVYIGMSPYLKPWSFWATRIATKTNGQPQWYLAKSNVLGDMNPAHILRECLTDPTWGMGYPESDIDDTSFTYAADLLFTEGMGMSLLWDKSITIEDFLLEVLKHIQGSIFVSRDTGKFVLKLARNDYVVGSLLVLNESNINKVSDYKKATVDELYNTVTVAFWDSSTGLDNSITVQDIALVGQQQTTIGTTRQFPGFTNGALAARVAERELRTVSTPLATATLMANREAASLTVGSVFVFSWPRYGVESIIMRVVSIEWGELTSNLVKISCIEDVFSLSLSSYTTPSYGEWADPVGDPVACSPHFPFEAPYWELAQRMGDTAAQLIPGTSSYAMMAVPAPAVYSSNARLMSLVGTTYQDQGEIDYCYTATLSAGVGYTETSFSISGSGLSNVTLGTYFKLDDEYIKVVTISDTLVTVGRGCLDSVSVPHLTGATLAFIDEPCETDGIERALAETCSLKVLPVTGKGTLALASAPVQNLTMVARHYKPYPPQRLRINGLVYPAAIGPAVNLVVDWVSRNRKTQTSILVDDQASTITAEDGTTYTLEVRTSGGTLIISKTGITLLTSTITVAELGANYGTIRVILFSVRDGVSSWQKHDYAFTRTAP